MPLLIFNNCAQLAQKISSGFSLYPCPLAYQLIFFTESCLVPDPVWIADSWFNKINLKQEKMMKRTQNMGHDLEYVPFVLSILRYHMVLLWKYKRDAIGNKERITDKK